VNDYRIPSADRQRSVTILKGTVRFFEAAALESLAKGEELCYEQQARRLLVFGALRARSDCTKCHELQRGALLGAFSYEFLGPHLAPNRRSETSGRNKSWRGDHHADRDRINKATDIRPGHR
jgi:hypothetical protein